MVAPTPMPAAPALLRPPDPVSAAVPAALVVGVLETGLSVCGAPLDMLGTGKVMPTSSSARTGAEAGVNNVKSDCCQATEMGFANAVVAASPTSMELLPATPDWEKLSSVSDEVSGCIHDQGELGAV